MCDVSLIIVNWNTVDHLINCLGSINKATRGINVEVIVVDNASEDGSVEMVQSEFPHVKLIRNCDNLGFAKANNIGIAASTGSFVCLVNSDVILGKDCVSKLVQYLNKNRNVGIVGPLIRNPDMSVQTSCYGYPTIWNMFCCALALDRLFPKVKLFGGRMMNYWTYDTVGSVDVLNGCFWCVRREALQEVGTLDGNFFMYGEDMDWCKRFRDAGWDVVFYPGAEAVHFGGGSSARAPIRFYIEMQRADLQYVTKHYGKRVAYIYRAIMCLFQFNRLVANSIIYCSNSRKRAGITYKIKRSAACLLWLFSGSRPKETA